MYKGVRYRVSCEELNAPLFTREASYKLANAWWKAKQADLDRPTFSEQIKGRWTTQDLLERLERAEAEFEAARAAIMLHGYRPNHNFPFFRIDIPDQDTRPKPKALYDLSSEEDCERLHQTLQDKPVQSDKTIGALCNRFLLHEQARGKRANTFHDLAYFITKLQKECPVLGPQLDATELNGRTVTDVFAWLRRKSGWSNHSQHKAFNHFRRWMRFIAGEEVIPLPLNLMDRIWTFDDGAREIKTYEVAEVQQMLKTIPERLRLYALLGLNCGMLSVDMAQLLHSEYKGGRIRRKRSKTAQHDSVPEVEYLLWPETVALLSKYPSTHPDLVLTSEAGTPLWTCEIIDGKRRINDLIGPQWRRKRGNRFAKPTIPLGAMRSISATLLRSHREHAWCYEIFLGHAPSRIADKHYAAHSQAHFDDALSWLRVQLLGETCPSACRSPRP
jgi:hypothetical protein